MNELRDRYDVESAWFADQEARYAAFRLATSKLMIEVAEEWRLDANRDVERHTLTLVDSGLTVHVIPSISEPSPGSARGTMSARRPPR